MRVGRPSRPLRRGFQRLVEPLEDRPLMSVVAFYYDPRYTQMTSPEGYPGSIIRIDAALRSLGHTLRRFDLYDGASLTTALAGADLVVLPSFRVPITRDQRVAALGAIGQFVAGGGGLITFSYEADTTYNGPPLTDQTLSFVTASLDYG